MEALVTIVEVGAYSERQYQKQDGTAEYFKSRGFVLKRGGDSFYGELTGEAASKNRDTQYDRQVPYIVKGFWKAVPFSLVMSLQNLIYLLANQSGIDSGVSSA